MKTTVRFFIAVLTFINAVAAEPTAFEKLQGFLSSKSFSTSDEGNQLTEKITIARRNESVVFHQILSSTGAQGSVSMDMIWTVPIQLLSSTQIRTQEFPDKTVKLSLVADDQANIFTCSCTTHMYTKDGRVANEQKTGVSDKLGLSFTNMLQAAEFSLLFKASMAEFKILTDKRTEQPTE